MGYNKARLLVPAFLACVGSVMPAMAMTEIIETSIEAPQNSGTIRIVGIVKDVSGETLIGVSVKVKGTTQGTVTDIDGNFILNAPADAVLEFNYMGYKTQDVPIKSRTSINVTLEEDAVQMDEVVAVGYGSQRKISMIGAQSGVKFVEDLKQPVATLSSVLAGRVAGIQDFFC